MVVRRRLTSFLALSRRFASQSLNGPRVAIVGSGPSGLFAAASLLRRIPEVSIDVIEASPVPFGLVRYGVAPDHQDVKNCIHSFEKMFNTHPSRISLFCNVRVGSSDNEVSVSSLRDRYSAVLLAYGANRPRRLNIPGSDSTNVLTGSEMVSWYSGWTSSSRTPLLDHPTAVIIGNGNVALDCARVLALAGRLADTDIPDSALSILRQSKVKNVVIVGRRGPANVSFTIKELREQFRMPGWSCGVEMTADDEAALHASLPSLERPKKRLMQVLLDHAGAPSGDQTCRFLFRRTPTLITPNEGGRVARIRFQTAGGTHEEVDCGLVVASLGYEPFLLDGLPKDEQGRLMMKDDARVSMSGDGAKLYAAGWCARGAHGVIADSQRAAAQVAQVIADDLLVDKDDEGIESHLKSRRLPYTGWQEWLEVDAKEKKEGEKRGKIREKILTF